MFSFDELVGVLGCPPSQPELQALLNQGRSDKSADLVEPEVKAYPDIVYHNYPALGLSFQFEPATSKTDASKANLQDLRLAAIDVYSGHEDKRWTCFPALPLTLKAARTDAVTHPLEVSIKSDTKGKDLVTDLGEPHRKGGGAGDRSGPAAWMEWSLQLKAADTAQERKFKLQVELAGAGARGADRWNAERAGACQWAVITIS
ncbi:hypothetical protein PSEUBRA_006283 [Kalmanozyma brasiliensis GHG001]|uniref:Uncharacterized protein n=1 Tax=Kalmanozyma brasiliensis (strain GHG001) TaxID=1365824 RepID=V5ERR7_KALBG|nr:uncharacterized protein PSEUBRA_006283 [Kalmanozyma brasiliensis GHG001]EST04539.1 hypothetical protein PSEUBRA_006283 [Kalmanozyma brasiliensis GHG001]